MERNSNRERGLNLLSLDGGGGVTGLSSLLILKEIMSRLREKGRLDTTPQPWEYFDMIGGTGTGAISAVMLGRLHMGVKATIESYNELMKTVFSQPKFTIRGNTGIFESTVMERELKKIVYEATGNEDEVMKEHGDRGARCKVVVYATSRYNMNTGGLPVLFRSYSDFEATTTSCTIWEALRATTAHPKIFKKFEVAIETPSLRNRFAGLGDNNPTAWLLDEARRQFPGRAVASIISIGTGHPETIQIGGTHHAKSWTLGKSMTSRVLRAAYEIAGANERVAEDMERRFADAKSAYCRLNVQQGAQGVKIDEWDRSDEVAEHTRAYLALAETGSKLKNVVDAIFHRAPSLDIAFIGESWQRIADAGSQLEPDGRIMPTPRPLEGRVRSCPLPSTRFTGREEHCEKVWVFFTARGRRRRLFVLHGLGGAGKTQIALKCAERLEERFIHVIFVDASSDESIKATLTTAALANKLGTTYPDALKWIANRGSSCLLIFDNADNRSVKLRTYLPPSAEYNVLITTRCQEFVGLADDTDAERNVSQMGPEDAKKLLLKTAKLARVGLSDEDKSAIQSILEGLGYLALAIVQAGAYIWRMKLSFAQYWAIYQEQCREALENDLQIDLHLDGYTRTVYSTWELSFNQLTMHAKELLLLIAFLRGSDIAKDIFQRAALNSSKYRPGQLSPTDQAAADHVRRYLTHFTHSDGSWHNSRFLSCMGELLSLSLVTYDRMKRIYSIHPLVQDWARGTAHDKPSAAQHSSILLALSIDWDGVLPRVNSSLQDHSGSGPDPTTQFAEVFHATGQPKDKTIQLEQALATRKISLGETHPDTLAVMNNLAETYLEQGQPENAARLQEAMLGSQRRELGERHPDSLASANNLAKTYIHMGRFAEAEILQVRVLVTSKQVFGKDHPNTLTAMMNLAFTYQQMGRLAEAEELQLTSLGARKRVLGENHPGVLSSMSNLAETYIRQGRWIEAKALQTAILHISTRLLGDEHPNTLSSMNNLARTYLQQGESEEAERLALAALAISKRVLGKDHPDTLNHMGSLASAYKRQGRLTEAESLEMETLAALRRVPGSRHPLTILPMRNLEDTFDKSGKPVERDAPRAELRPISSGDT
ncbi:unnamed protein product [Rhizoctonia solani]|uniref:PNPLA domain-containing protein n=1 Tax=Rhizoctonia solani TaxID=456999 RepID=A0A8H3D816_9AGAM|nr:unnamed protein product [Rhizoctonia solani]